jgi:single-stranded DNA-specific DHH superfamily exonuclease
MIATKEQAKEFLDEISKEDKIALIFHDDLDGFASGVLIYDFLKKKCKNISVFPTGISKEMLSNLKDNVKDKNKLIFLDLSLDFLASELISLSEKKETLWIDHHKKEVEIKEENILEYKTISAICVTRTCYELVDGKRWLALAGIISDAGNKYSENTELIASILKEKNMGFEEYLEKIVNRLSYVIIYFESDLEKAFELIRSLESDKHLEKLEKYYSQVEKEVERIVGEFDTKSEKIGKINFYYFKPKYFIKGIVINKISFKSPNHIYIFANPDGKMIKLSGRCQQGCSVLDILKKSVEGLKDSGAGGHIPAAGGFILKKDLAKFKENLRKISDNL